MRRVLAALLLSLGTSAALVAQCPPTTVPHTPANGLVTSETRIAFGWNPAGSDVTGYDLFLSQSGGTPSVICRNSPSPNCSATLPVARYEWFVRSYPPHCLSGTESAHSTLEIVCCTAPVAPTTLTPSGGAGTAA